jgi:hypothetical protein
MKIGKVSRRYTFWIIIAGAISLVWLIALCLPRVHFDQRPSGQGVIPAPSANDSLHANVSPDLARDAEQSPQDAEQSQQDAEQSQQEEAKISPPPVPSLDAASHQKIVAAMNARMHEQTKALYGPLFQQLQLTGDLQEKVMNILTQPQQQLEQQAYEAAQSGKFPTPPSPEALQEQQLQQDQQLRSVLGDTDFAAFNQYRASIPDRMIVNDLNQQGANLTDSQSAQLVQILTEARQQIIAQAGVTQNLDSMSPDSARSIMQQQEALLQQTVNDRVQNLLTPQQVEALQGVFSKYSLTPKGQ